MKLKKLLALALAGVLMLALLTGCSGGGNGEDRLVAEAVADIFKGNSQNVEVSYSVPALTRTIRPAFTPGWFQEDAEGNICKLNRDFYINPSQTLDGFLQDSLKDYRVQNNYVGFYAFDSTGMSADAQAEQFEKINNNTNDAPKVTVYAEPVRYDYITKLRVEVCHKTVAGQKYCLVVVVGTR